MFAPKYYNRMKQKAAKIEVTSTCKLLSVPAWVGIIGFGSSLISIVFLFLLKSKLFSDVTYYFGCTVEDGARIVEDSVSAHRRTEVEKNCRTITLYKTITICMLVLSFIFLTMFCIAQYKVNKSEQMDIRVSKHKSKDHKDNVV